MRKTRWTWTILLSLSLVPWPAQAKDDSAPKNLLNPVIGLNTLFLAQAAPDYNRPYGIAFQEAALSLSAVVDPHWKLFSNFVFEMEDGEPKVDVEELFAVSTSIPEFQFKIGKVYANFGKHATLRAYAFPFVNAPQALGPTIGDDGFKAAGIEATWSPSLPWVFQMTLGGYQAFLPGQQDGPLNFQGLEHENIPWLVRLKNLIDLDDNDATLELGVSYLNGMGSDGLHHSVLGTDLTLKNVPPKESDQAAWIFQGEYLQRGSWDALGAYLTEADGWYASFQYRVLSEWWVGIRAEEAYHGMPEILGGSVLGVIQKATANIAWVPSPNSFIRLEYGILRADDYNGYAPLDHRLYLQFDYNIGSTQASPSS